VSETTFRSESCCSWCHRLNPASANFCAQCGHEAHKPRLLCRCTRCRTGDVSRLTNAEMDTLLGVRRRPQGKN